MKKVLIAAALAVAPTTALAQNMTYYLVTQWVEGGNRFCKYSNGAILPVGYGICPLSIKGY